MENNWNQPKEYIEVDGHKIPFFSERFGKNTEKMPELLSDRRVPVSIARRAQRILDKTGVSATWTDNYADTGDLKAQKGSEVKLILTTYADGSLTDLGREALSWINSQEELTNRAVALGIDRRYKQLQEEENGVFTRKRDKLAEFIDEPLTEQQALDSFFWKVAHRHPDVVPEQFAIPGLHEQIVPYLFSEFQRRFAPRTEKNEIKIMAVYPGTVSDDVAELRAWCVAGLGNGSSAYGGGDLGGGLGRLLAEIAPEVPNALGKGTRIPPYTQADVERYTKGVSALRQTFGDTSQVIQNLASLEGKV
ncbi:MAG: hypothetical protein ABIG28_01635 [archaeon]